MAVLMAVLWLCKVDGCANTSVAVLICWGNFTDMSNKLADTSDNCCNMSDVLNWLKRDNFT